MSPLNELMNHVAGLSYSSSTFVKGFSTRGIMFFGGIPLEVLATLQNIIKLPFETALMICKVPLNIVNLCAKSKSLTEIVNELPGPCKVIQTALKVVGYAIGTVFTAILGLISPYHNFRLHVLTRLVRDEAAEAEKLSKQLREQKEAEDQELLVKTRVQILIDAHKKENKAPSEPVQARELLIPAIV